ncbi:acyltransferase [Caulobacter flavus]|uniref:Acyltransferase n=1 Tax=Caulobacter flavus TaxID=1679497 RepID=A0A2N5CPY1_9CAUL|nr:MULTISPECIES: acyltransferase [Caulobacter]PLR09225.1 acyltransferase [Caulobacter flavus]
MSSPILLPDAASPRGQPPVHAPAAPAQIPALTSLRFILAVGVVVFHYQVTMLASGQAPIALIERARLGVDVFFILSGFVLAHVYGRQICEGRYSHRAFLIARLARIYPAHLAVLLGMGLIASIALALGQAFDQRVYTPSGWLAHLAMIHAWIPVVPPSEWNGPSWSISAEWAAYLAFPLFAFIGLRNGRNPLLTIAVAAVVFAACDAFYRWRYGQIITGADSVLGVVRIPGEFLYGLALQQISQRLAVTRRAAIALSLAATLLVLSLMHASADERIIVAASGLLVLSLALLSQNEADGPLGHPLALLAGEASYAIYLVHMPLLVVWKNAVALLAGTDSSYRMALWEAAVLLPITLVVGLLLHLLWEAPARRWVRARFSAASPSPSSPSSERHS